MRTSTERSRARGKRGSYAKTEATRTAILDAALEVFAQSGFRSGSLRDVAAKVGMSEAGMLYHFPSKSALLAAVLERRDEHAQDFVPLGTHDPADTLRGLVDLADYNASVPGVVELYCILSAEATTPDHPAHTYFVTRYEDTRRRVSEAFERLRSEGRLRVEIDPTEAAVATLSMMDGLQVQWLLDRDAVDMAESLRGFFRSIVEIDFPAT